MEKISINKSNIVSLRLTAARFKRIEDEISADFSEETFTKQKYANHVLKQLIDMPHNTGPDHL